MKAPVEMPSRIALQDFELQRVDYGAPEASGRINGVQSGFPLWRGIWSLARLPEEESDTWRAWLIGLRGAARRFIGRDVLRAFPKEYPDGFADFTPFTGEATDWSETINADDDSELTLTGIPEGLILSVGDYVGFKWTATEASVAGIEWRAIVRVVEGATADAGGELTLIVEPPVPSAVPASAVAHLDNPGCIMAIVLEETSLQPLDLVKTVPGGTITGVQDIRS